MRLECIKFGVCINVTKHKARNVAVKCNHIAFAERMIIKNIPKGKLGGDVQ